MSFLHPIAVAAACLVLLAPVRACAAGDTWRFDPVHSQVVLFADHLGFSHGIGRAHVLEGWIRFNPDDWSSAAVDVVVDLAGLDMGEAKWTQTVRSAQFLDVARWPTARFISSSVDKATATTALVHGTLTLRGVSKPLSIEVTFNRLGRDPYAFKTKAGFSAHARVDRFDFGMQRYREVVGADVELRIEVEGIRDDNATEKEHVDAAQEH